MPLILAVVTTNALSQLFLKYGILVAITEYNRNVIRIEPPLIIEKEHIDYLIDAFDKLLGSGVTGIVSSYIKSNFG